MYICTYIFMYTYIHAYMYIYICMYIYTFTCVYIFAHMYTYALQRVVVCCCSVFSILQLPKSTLVRVINMYLFNVVVCCSML